MKKYKILNITNFITNAFEENDLLFFEVVTCFDSKKITIKYPDMFKNKILLLFQLLKK